MNVCGQFKRNALKILTLCIFASTANVVTPFLMRWCQKLNVRPISAAFQESYESKIDFSDKIFGHLDFIIHNSDVAEVTAYVNVDESLPRVSFKRSRDDANYNDPSGSNKNITIVNSAFQNTDLQTYDIKYNDNDYGYLEVHLCRSRLSSSSSLSAIDNIYNICTYCANNIATTIALESTTYYIDKQQVDILSYSQDISNSAFTTRTLVKLLSNRLSKEDEIGKESISNILDQIDYISDTAAIIKDQLYRSS